MAERLVPLGKIVAAHGLDGWLRFHPYNPATRAFATKRVFIVEKDGQHWNLEIESSKPHKKSHLIKFLGVDAIEHAEEWLGSTVYVESDSLDPLEPNQYYQYQAVGLAVFDLRGERIGVITGVGSTLAGEIYIVQGASKEYLIPAVKEIVERIDFAEAKMYINPPEGLLDL